MKLARAEIERVVRHTVTPFVVIAVERGWLPDYVAGEATEAVTVLVALAGVYLWSLRNERIRSADVVSASPEKQQAGALDSDRGGATDGPQDPRQAAAAQGSETGTGAGT